MPGNNHVFTGLLHYAKNPLSWILRQGSEQPISNERVFVYHPEDPKESHLVLDLDASLALTRHNELPVSIKKILAYIKIGDKNVL